LGLKLLLLTLGLTFGNWIVGRVYQQTEKNRVFNSVPKPVLNAGCGSLPPYGDVNLDVDVRSAPNFVRGSVEMLPFRDGAFKSCVASHVLEHVNNPERALSECNRVAENVYVIEPPLWDVGTWLTPTHKWLVIKGSSVKFLRYDPVGGWGLLAWKLILAGGR